MSQENTNRRISPFTGGAMVTISFLFDVLEGALILGGVGVFLNPVITSIKWFIFWFWFKINDVSFTKFDKEGAQKKVVVVISTFLIGMVPVLNALPEFTFGIIIILFIIRAEDKLGAPISNKAPEGRTLSREKRRVIKRKERELAHNA